MKRTGLVAVIVSALLLGSVGAASAGPATFAVSPDEALQGGTVQVSGVCADDANDWTVVSLSLDGPDFTFFELGDFPITPGVAWEFDVIIPTDAPAGATTIAKQCIRVDGDGGFDGGDTTERLDFTVLEVPPETTTTLAPEPTTSTTPQSAVAVAAAPSFTG